MDYRFAGNQAFDPDAVDHIRNRVTYEVNIGREPLHPDTSIHWRFIEVAMSDCEYGCKIYADPMSSVRVLVHNPVYGCKDKP